MTDITPPAGLIKEWMSEFYVYGAPAAPGELTLLIATRAAQWGANQELEACCALLQQKGVPAWSLLRLHRRPKSPSLKEQGLQALEALQQRTTDPNIIEPLRRALEALPDD